MARRADSSTAGQTRVRFRLSFGRDLRRAHRERFRHADDARALGCARRRTAKGCALAREPLSLRRPRPHARLPRMATDALTATKFPRAATLRLAAIQTIKEWSVISGQFQTVFY